MSGVPHLQAREPLVGHTRRVSCVALTADGGQLLSGSLDRTLRVWDLGTGRGAATEATSGAAQCLAVSADGRRAAAGTYDRRIFVWDVSRPA